LFFAARDGTSGRELWASDGTEAGTNQVADINPTGSSSPRDFVDSGSNVFFSATDGTHGFEPWMVTAS
jgi:ELWxxDGT repeat protein